MNYTQIIVDHQEKVTWIKLNRPEKMNALTPLMLKEWIHAMETAHKSAECRAIVVTGEGRAFSAGVDLAVFQEIKVEPGFDMHADGMRIMELLETLPMPTIAMVNGFCYTGAMELMMAFDLIYVAEDAKIGDTHAKWGIPPKWGMTQRLQHQVGLRKAKEMSFLTESITGIEATRIGLANKALPLSELKSFVELQLDKIIKNSGQTIAAIKAMYDYGSKHSLKEGIEFELDYKVELTDKVEDLKSFKSKI